MWFNNRKKRQEDGFTLIELMVVIVIMTIVYAISMGNYAKMGKKTDLENTIYSLALTVREVQYYGINKKLKDNNFSDKDPYPFGIHLDSNDKKKIISFVDFNNGGNDKFDGDCNNAGNPNKECRQVIKFPRGIKIKSVQFWDDSNSQWKSEDPNFSKINVLFKRPDPDAKIIKEDTGRVYSKIKVNIQDSSGAFEGAFVIGAAGDISVKKVVEK